MWREKYEKRSPIKEDSLRKFILLNSFNAKEPPYFTPPRSMINVRGHFSLPCQRCNRKPRSTKKQSGEKNSYNDSPIRRKMEFSFENKKESPPVAGMMKIKECKRAGKSGNDPPGNTTKENAVITE
ncbi:hypothetical protein TNCV_1846651 [Trichonephila clavipes]|nr:hypothetical protein TNCV_1846651 [Trichonephila clavipes]